MAFLSAPVVLGRRTSGTGQPLMFLQRECVGDRVDGPDRDYSSRLFLPSTGVADGGFVILLR